MTILLTLLACDPSTPELDPEPFSITLPSGGCGLDPYPWVAPDRLGEIVSVEYLPDASFSAETLDFLLIAAGLDVLTPVSNGTQVYRVRYLTQDRGELIEATSLMAFPDTTSAQEYPTLLWVRPTVGFSDACALSGRGFEEQLGQTLLASHGFAVVAPDLLGMNGTGDPSTFLHPYIVPEPTAVAALDAIRAMWSLADSEPDILAEPTTETVLWGASEGGFGAIWADRYGTGYLPELDIRAVVASVPPTDLLTLSAEALTTYTDATVGFVAVLTTGHDWYRSDMPLADVLTDEDPSFLASSVELFLEATCDEEPLPDPTDGATAVSDLFLPGFIDAVLNEDWSGFEDARCASERATLTSTQIPRGSDAPVLYQVSENDELVLGYVGRAHAPRLCDAGYVLEYLECAGADHETGAGLSLPYQLEWVKERLAGVPLDDPCVISEPIDCEQFGVVIP